MATSAKAPAASTPKQPQAGTPSLVTLSPRQVNPMGTPLAGKSPANETPAKTPASLHGRSHNVSVTSQPNSSPLAARLNEDMMSYTPTGAATMGYMKSSGLTPLPSGYGSSNIVGGVPSKEGSVTVTRNVEEEKIRRLEEVQRLLKQRLSGRGIYREAVERIAQQSSLNHAWIDGTLLSIAGQKVDLEIKFDAVQRDLVNDVVLKVAEEWKEEASEVLKRNLSQSATGVSAAPWHGLTDFSTNLDRLAHLDALSQGINCFEALEGLSYSFRRIWDEERKRLQSKQILTHLCRSAVGRQKTGKRQHTGYFFDYWVDNRKLKEPTAKAANDDAMDIDSANTIEAEDAGVWCYRLGCDSHESEESTVPVSKDWVADNVFSVDAKGQNIEGAEQPAIAWLEPKSTPPASELKDNSAMAVEDSTANEVVEKPIKIRYTVELTPFVLVPDSVVTLFRSNGLILPKPESLRSVTYGQALSDHGSSNLRTPGSWLRRLSVQISNGQTRYVDQAYSIHEASSQGWSPLHSFGFQHPRQLAEALPVLRQYALLWNILRQSAITDTSAVSSAAPVPEDVGAPRKTKSREPRIRSNVTPQMAKLNSMLNGHSSTSAAPACKISIKLGTSSTVLDKVKLNVYFPLRGLHTSRAGGTVCVEVERNGDLRVSSSSGVPFLGSNIALQQATSVLTISEDLGVLVEWILSKLAV